MHMRDLDAQHAPVAIRCQQKKGEAHWWVTAVCAHADCRASKPMAMYGQACACRVLLTIVCCAALHAAAIAAVSPDVKVVRRLR